MSARLDAEDERTAPPLRDRARTGDRSTAALACGAAAAAGVLLLGLLPVPYAVERPGPVYDVLGSVGDTELITVEGERTYPTDGALELTTVGQLGGPGSEVDLASVVAAWLDPAQQALPVEQVFPGEPDPEQVREAGVEQMATSQENATVAALTELGRPVPTTLTVAGFTEGSRAEGPLREGDVVLAVDGVATPDLRTLRDLLVAGAAGREVRVRVRGSGTGAGAGEVREEDVATVAGPQGAALGVLVDPTFDLAASGTSVEIQIDRVSGPSGGLVFALGIIDELTPGAMTGGERIAGTGTVDSTGEVGPIGGAALKVVGASRAGARWFLVPEANCADAAPAVPDGVVLVAVSTVGQARAAVEAIGAGRTADLPACPAATAAGQAAPPSP